MKPFFDAFGLTSAQSVRPGGRLAAQAPEDPDDAGDARQRAWATMDADMRARVEREGGEQGDVTISLKWDNSGGA